MGGIFGGGDSGSVTYVPSTNTVTEADDPTQADAAESDVDNTAKQLAAAGEENLNTSPLGDTSSATVKTPSAGGF